MISVFNSSFFIESLFVRVFMEIGVQGGRKLGRLTILLYPDIVPVTVKNFLQLIINAKRQEKADRKGLKVSLSHFIGSLIYR